MEYKDLKTDRERAIWAAAAKWATDYANNEWTKFVKGNMIAELSEQPRDSRGRFTKIKDNTEIVVNHMDGSQSSFRTE